MMAVAHADQVIQLQTDLDAKELPEDWVFQVPWLLAAHVKRVVAARSSSSRPDDTDWDDEDVYERAPEDVFANWR